MPSLDSALLEGVARALRLQAIQTYLLTNSPENLIRSLRKTSTRAANNVNLQLHESCQGMDQPPETQLNQLRSLTPDQVSHFRQHGFLSIGKVLEGEQLAELQSEYDGVFAEARQSANMRNLSSSDGAPTTESDEEMLQIMQMCERSLLFRKLLYDERILDMVEDLIGPNLQLFHDQALFKPAHQGGPVLWHQDNAYWACEPANLVSCWMTLDDVDVHNGAMHVIPGSHLQALEHERDDSSPLLDRGEQVDDSDALIIDLPAGGIMFHHCQMLHHTPRNTTDRQRRAFAVHYMNPGTRSSDGAEMEVSFARPMLRMRA